MTEQPARQRLQTLRAGRCRSAGDEGRGLAGGQRLLHQRQRIGGIEILGHLLAARQVVQAQVVADQDVEHRT